ncbi:hypothetical protein PsorP6_017771 [Peronosclerospora sorghi]|uniref:Uncharacterized protein n=1 Tax=Peronosclerospora sorghi TaxID=230839 RepID=A0ACC0WPF1_9STRA|nr:hypothetical protein PsorP6_017771 [Peronosclerospora sorghi]
MIKLPPVELDFISRFGADPRTSNGMETAEVKLFSSSEDQKVKKKPPPVDLDLSLRFRPDPIWNLLERAKVKLEAYLDQKVKDLYRTILGETDPSKKREIFDSAVADDEDLKNVIAKLRPKTELGEAAAEKVHLLAEKIPSLPPSTRNLISKYEIDTQRVLDKATVLISSHDLPIERIYYQALGSELFERVDPIVFESLSPSVTSGVKRKRTLTDEQAFDMLGHYKEELKEMWSNPHSLLVKREWLEQHVDLDVWMIVEMLYGSEYFKFNDYIYFMDHFK